jgi:hypothetical protein
MKIAFLVIRNKFSANNVAEFIDAIKKYSVNEIREINPNSKGYFEFDLNNYDCICLHYSAVAFPMRVMRPFSESFRLRLKKFTGVKVAFVQDEQRALLDRIDFLNLIGLDHLFSPSPEGNLHLLYPPKDCSFNTSSIMTSYVVPSRDMKKIDIKNRRKWDLFYRGRDLPNWLGESAIRKREFGVNLVKNLNAAKLKHNISSSESLRIYGKYWYHFLYLSKSSLLTPSGTKIIDMDGRYLEKWVKPEMPKLHNCEPLELDNRMISPKLFEYAEWGSLIVSDHRIQIDKFIADHHYFLIDEDYSNITSLMNILNDDTVRFSMSEAARERLINNEDFSYEVLSKHFDKIISDHLKTIEAEYPQPTNLSDSAFATISLKLVLLIKLIPSNVVNGMIWFVNNFIRTINFVIRFVRYSN